MVRFVDTGDSDILDVGDNASFDFADEVLPSTELVAALPTVVRRAFAFFCMSFCKSAGERVKLNLFGGPVALSVLPALEIEGGLNEKSSSSMPIFNFCVLGGG